MEHGINLRDVCEIMVMMFEIEKILIWRIKLGLNQDVPGCAGL